MDNIKFTVSGLGESFSASVPADIAQLWMESQGLRSIEDAAKAIVSPIIIKGYELKATTDARSAIDGLK